LLPLYYGDLESKNHVGNAGTRAAGCFGLQKIQLVNDVIFANKATDIKDTLSEDSIFDPFAHLLLKLDAYLLGLVKLVMLVISEELRMHQEYFIYVCRALLRRVDSIAVLPVHSVVAPLDLKVDTHEAALALSPSEKTRGGRHVQGDHPESDQEVLLINVFNKPLYVFRHPALSSYFYNYLNEISQGTCRPGLRHGKDHCGRSSLDLLLSSKYYPLGWLLGRATSHV
jgi:hypothetical protein